MNNKEIKQKLKEIMQFIITTYTKGCAVYNWQNTDYINILNNKREIEDYEFDNIVKECMDEFIYEDLDLCGCGNPYKTNEIIRLILIAQTKEGWDNKKNALNSICNIDISENNNYDGLIQFVLYILDSHEFLEHGGCISSAWLTEKGKLFLDLLNIWEQIENDEEENN